tara:strand:- start:26 stop:355 length:330 start_codon:yes stop_codon:yes gene_type:complete
MAELSKLFKGRQKDLAKIVEEDDAGTDFSPDCPAIIELKQDKELNKELNLQIDENCYTLDDLLNFLKLSKTKITECKVKVKKVDDSVLHLKFHEGTIILHSDFTFDWEI